MKVLALTNLFPNAVETAKGVFNRQQLLALSRLCELQIVAPVPWFPKFLPNNPRAFYSRIQREEIVDGGVQVFHPRYFILPRVGRSLYGRQYFAGVRKKIEEIRSSFDFDVLFATWAYPDAYAGALLAREMDKPLVVKVHGTDVNVTADFFLRRQMMRTAFRRAVSVIAVSEALKNRVASLGIAGEKIVVLPNGIDEQLFCMREKDACAKKLGLDTERKQIAYIGNLVEIKGVRYLIEAMSLLSDQAVLHVVGDGPLKDDLRRLANRLGIASRVAFWGRLPHAEIPYWLNAADALALPSLNEGCPNVVLEALACRLPVVASDVGGVSELINGEDQGLLVPAADPPALAAALAKVLARASDRRSAPSEKTMSWEDNARALHAVLANATRSGEVAR